VVVVSVSPSFDVCALGDGDVAHRATLRRVVEVGDVVGAEARLEDHRVALVARAALARLALVHRVEQRVDAGVASSGRRRKSGPNGSFAISVQRCQTSSPFCTLRKRGAS
jgi:hypothetical protein